MPRIEGRLDSSETAVLAINLTNAFWREAPLYLCENIGDFLTVCREKEVRIIYAENEYREDEKDKTVNMKKVYGEGKLIENTEDTQICRYFQPQEEDTFIRMNSMSAFFNTDLEIVLRCCGIKTIIILGARTDCECFISARDAFYRDYQVIVASDLTISGEHRDFYHNETIFSSQDYHVAFLNNLFTVMNADILKREEILNKIEKTEE